MGANGELNEGGRTKKKVEGIYAYFTPMLSISARIAGAVDGEVEKQVRLAEGQLLPSSLRAWRHKHIMHKPS